MDIMKKMVAIHVNFVATSAQHVLKLQPIVILVLETELPHQLVHAQKIPSKKEPKHAHHAQMNVPLVNQTELVLLVLLIET